jgi:hypothetical protein
VASKRELRCSQCNRTFEFWPEPFHYWYTRGGTRLICQGTRWGASPVAQPGPEDTDNDPEQMRNDGEAET